MKFRCERETLAEALATLKQPGKVRLPRRKVCALLLLGNALCLRVALIEQIADDVAGGHLLLASKICRCDTRAITETSASANSGAKSA